VSEGPRVRPDAAGPVHARPAAARAQGVASALGERRRPRTGTGGRAGRDPPHPRRRLRPGAAEHDRDLPHLVRLSSRRDLPVWRGPGRMTQPPVGARRATPSRRASPPSDRQLTTEQADAVRAGPEGAFLVAAGPGTGKTFTIV